jgi:Domain of unknown function (DUF4157)
MRTHVVKQPIQDSAKYSQEVTRSTLTPVEMRSNTISPLSTGIPLIQHQCACGGGCPRCQENLTLQTKLKIGEPGDVYEQEADRIADEVMQMPEPSIQRQVGAEEEEMMVQREAIARQDTSEVPSIVHEVLNSSSGHPLDPKTRAFMEPRFGQDFGQVQVYNDAKADESAQSVNALAYTVGKNVVFSRGQYMPETIQGTKLLAHELTHVVQQMSNTVQAVTEIGQPGDVFEQEAEQVSEQIVQAQMGLASEVSSNKAKQILPTIQRQAVKLQRVTYDEAKKIHLTQQKQVLDVLTEGLLKDPDPSKGLADPDNLFHNTAEWIETGDLNLAVMTPTHYGYNQSTTKPIPYFDANVWHPRIGGDYPLDPVGLHPSPDSIVLVPLGRNGEMKSTAKPPLLLLFINDQKPVEPKQIKNTLVHELQHLADQHDGSWSSLGSFFGKTYDLSFDFKWSSYQTEFRAFWLQPATSTYDNFGSAQEPAKNDRRVTLSSLKPGCTISSQPTNFQNQRQEKIFWNMSLESYHFEEFYVCNEEFKKRVDEFAFPVSGNLVNSVRIQALSEALEKCGKQMNMFSAPVLRVIDVGRRLDEIDRQFVNDEGISKPLWNQAQKHLPDDVLDIFAELIKIGKLRTPKTPGDFSEPQGGVAPV